MTFTNQEQKKSAKVSGQKLEELIANAIRKVGASKENDLCKYLPVSTGGYIHHFTMRKMKTEDPDKLSEMIDSFIIQTERPGVVAPKPRAARGSRKRRDQPSLTKNDLERLLNIARLAGDTEMIAKLTPRKSLATIKRELINNVRQNVADQELWNSFVEVLKHQLTADGKIDNAALSNRISSELANAANSALLSDVKNR
ncbi:Uncharacterized protein SCG7109_AA_00340 [Chlamydiales bacterium SCGC AG-110-M15]|nr:Uncharacterized protein SCG7109_AA_00340 [Chlamydiales bacterium SCGC AG-110-M15]